MNGITALHAAVQHGRLRTVMLLVKAGAIVDSPNNEGVRPIHAALQTNPLNLDIVQLLLSNKADLGKPDETGVTPLNIIFNSKNTNLHLLIINNDVNEDVRKAFEPFLLYAMFCVNKDIRILQALLAHGMDKNIVLKNGWTPLHYACGMGCMDIAEFLIREGADLQAKSMPDNKEIIRTPLECITKPEHMKNLLGVVARLRTGRNAEGVSNAVDDGDQVTL